jgi:hypothetical protein
MEAVSVSEYSWTYTGLHVVTFEKVLIFMLPNVLNC